jgi:hypothetical protein
MSPTHSASGLDGGWLNAWLAAVGITVLLPEARLAWSGGGRPHAIIHVPTDDLPSAIAAALPPADALGALAIAKKLDDGTTLGQRFSSDAFAARAGRARATGDWTLGVLATDAVDTGEPVNSPFNTPAPKGLTLHDRFASCRGALADDASGRIAASLAGRGTRVKMNGLGFDVTRILVASDPRGDKWVDPVVETLAFFGLAMVPCRGDGTRRSARGWHDSPSRPGAFCWPTWEPPLSAAAIDGVLDVFWNADLDRRRRSKGRGAGWRWPNPVRRVYCSVPYQPQGSSDATRGYASEVLA